MVARDAAIAGYEGGRVHMQHLSARESVEAVAAAKARGIQITCEASARTTSGSPTRRARPRHAAEDEPAAAHRGRPPGADRRPARPARSTASPPTTRRTRARRRRCRSSRRRWARPGWRPRSPRVYTELVLPGVLPLAPGRRAADAGAALFDLPTPRIEVGEPANLAPVDLDAEWEVGEDGYESPLGELLLRRPHAAAAACCHRRRGRRRLPERAFARGAAAYRLRPARRRHALRRRCLGADGPATGEVVFTTGMSGYQESMTDPSFAGQLITFTTAHRQLRRLGGRDGVRRHPRAGAIMRAATDDEDAPGAEGGWLDWLRDCGIPGSTASTPARSYATSATPARCAAASSQPRREDEARELSRPSRDGRPRPGARGHAAAPHVYPGEGAARGSRDRHRDEGLDHAEPERARRDARAPSLHERGRGSAGARPRRLLPRHRPRRPCRLGYIVDTSAALLARSPSSASASATSCSAARSGLETFKLPFGHRGANHPVKDLRTGRIEITAQNHGFAVAGDAGGLRGVRPRRPRSSPTSTSTTARSRGSAARRPRRHCPVPPRGGSRPQRLPRPLRRVHRPFATHAA